MADPCPDCCAEAERCPDCGRFLDHYVSQRLCRGDTCFGYEPCKDATIARLREQLAATKAQLDRSRLLLIKSRDAIDLAIGELGVSGG